MYIHRIQIGNRKIYVADQEKLDSMNVKAEVYNVCDNIYVITPLTKGDVAEMCIGDSFSYDFAIPLGEKPVDNNIYVWGYPDDARIFGKLINLTEDFNKRVLTELTLVRVNEALEVVDMQPSQVKQYEYLIQLLALGQFDIHFVHGPMKSSELVMHCRLYTPVKLAFVNKYRTGYVLDENGDWHRGNYYGYADGTCTIG